MGIAFGGSKEGIYPYRELLEPKNQKARKYTFSVLLIVEPAEDGTPELIKERTCEFTITNEYPRLRQIHTIGIWEELVRLLDERLKEFGVDVKWK